ncbi:carbohydrate kinase family protein [Microvirga antarctica]|uniref:carbohydrate kinase family protein n=1 Tax=Microvirga antarctica TaxID=2819233 RepID=UPI001B308407|nr:PfkB family carbohydrate kinase [Microvirga antarctica]
MPDVSGGAVGGVLCLGRTYCDLVFTGLSGMPVLGRELFARDVAVVPGGGAFITAAHLARFGRSAALVSRLGTDPLSLGLDVGLLESGVDLSFVERAADAGPQLTVAMVQAQDRAFLSRRAGHGHPATLEAALDAPGMRHLHIAEYATLAEIVHLVARAKQKGLTVSLDPSWDEDLIYRADFLQTCQGIDAFLPNVEEMAALAGTTKIEQGLDCLTAHFPLVVLKRGADGAILARGGDRFVRTAPKVNVIDTTGAGDAFNAGFLHVWLAGGDGASCLEAAIAAGSLSVQASGGVSALNSLA